MPAWLAVRFIPYRFFNEMYFKKTTSVVPDRDAAANEMRYIFRKMEVERGIYMQYSVRKRVAALVLAFSVLICSFVSSVNVQAMDMSEWEDFIAEFGVTTTVVKFIMTEIFKLAVGDLDGMIQDSLAMQDYIIAMQEKYGSQSGTLEIEEADLKELYEIAKDSIKAMDGYYLVEPTFTADGFIFQSGNDVSDVSAIDHYRNLFLEKNIYFPA